MVVNIRDENLSDMAGATVASAINSARNRSYASWVTIGP